MNSLFTHANLQENFPVSPKLVDVTARLQLFERVFSGNIINAIENHVRTVHSVTLNHDKLWLGYQIVILDKVLSVFNDADITRIVTSGLTPSDTKVIDMASALHRSTITYAVLEFANEELCAAGLPTMSATDVIV
jgi:hypothetical protein